MAEHTFHFWMIGRPEAEADAAYEAGLTDGNWVYKGGMMFVQFTREAATMAEAAATAAEELRRHGVPFDERTLNLTDPTELLEEHPGYYEQDELEEQIAEIESEGDDATDDDKRRLVFLKANLKLLLETEPA
jgi:hypothetical protein